MAGIYIHIPYCRKACHYCDFHFSTVLKTKERMVSGLVSELTMRKDEQKNLVETIYFGGGTPSVLDKTELVLIFETLHKTYSVSPSAEITLEANPEDITQELLEFWLSLGVNRLSIGVQSFSDDILKWMNRNHSALQSEKSVKLSQDLGLTNISIDLIYGIHSRSIADWQNELDQAISLNTPHVSAYCLTIEEGTVFHKKAEKGNAISLPDEAVEKEFFALINSLKQSGIEMYEISNFSKPGMESRHNSSYWAGKPYLGIGPGAHSFDGDSLRSWNVSNNGLYMKGEEEGERHFESEKLNLSELYNEYVMTGLRQAKGIKTNDLKTRFNVDLKTEFEKELLLYKTEGLLHTNQSTISLTTKGLLLADKIASDFFK